MQDKYTGLTKEVFDLISSRYAAFQDACNDTTKEPVKVFDPLSKKSMDELYLIREVSKDLQTKKDEDAKRAAQAAEEQKQETEQKEESDDAEKKTETSESEK